MTCCVLMAELPLRGGLSGILGGERWRYTVPRCNSMFLRLRTQQEFEVDAVKYMLDMRKFRAPRRRNRNVAFRFMQLLISFEVQGRCHWWTMIGAASATLSDRADHSPELLIFRRR
jgi:hypothetical protein